MKSQGNSQSCKIANYKCNIRFVITIGLLVFSTLLSSGLLANNPSDTSSQYGYKAKQIIANVQYVVDNNLIVGKMTADGKMTLPLGIGSSDGKLLIVLDSAYSTRQGTFFRAVSSVILPGTTEQLVFAADNVAFTPGGLALSSGSRLELISSHGIDINDNVRLEISSDGRTFIEWDCNGFKSINIKGNFVFKESLLVPDTTVVKNQSKVTASFEVNTKDINNIMASVNITPFRIKGFEDFGFEVRNATVDMSDIYNPAGFVFPQEYQNACGNDINLWRGFFVNDFIVRIPQQFTPGKPVKTIEAKNLLIDDAGVSGVFAANNLLSDGDMDGWPFTIEHLEVQLIRNKLRGGGLGGSMNIPFLGKDTLGYTARMFDDGGDLNYAFGVNLRNDKQYEMPFGGDVTLSECSRIDVSKTTQGSFSATAVLNGIMTLKQKLLNIENVRFQNLTLTTRAPYLTNGVFAVTNGKSSRVNSYPISINNFQLGINNGTASIGANVMLNFMGESDKGFSGSTFVTVSAKHVIEQDAKGYAKKTWKFDKLKFGEIAINCKGVMAFDLDGELNIFDDDAVYGNGYAGSLSVKIPVVGKIAATAYFGCKDDNKYWGTSLLVPVKIPVFAVLYIDGIMGGLSYHMKQPVNYAPDFNIKAVSENTALNNGSYVPMRLAYVPDKTAGLGVMAGVTLVAANKRVFNGEAKFEIVFNDGGGLKYITFKGDAYFLKLTEELGDKIAGLADKMPKNMGLDGASANSNGSPLYASLNVSYDNDNKIFHANLSTYLNVAGVLKGNGPNNLMGEGVIHIAPDNWYIYAGRPSKPNGVSILNLLNTYSYFMVGSKLDPFPVPAPQVAKVFDKANIDFMAQENALATGGGFGFGARFDAKFGVDKFFYAYLNVGGGADVMLRNISGIHCKGQDGPIGMDGWYAAAQAYAYLDGRIGIKVRKRRFDVLALSAAVLLQAKLPNPTWFKGAIGVKYSVLGGLVKGNFTADVVVGDQCELMADGKEIDIKVISDLSPAGGNGASIFVTPQVAFNTAINQEFSMMNLEDVVNTYRVKLDECKLLKAGAETPTTIKWNSRQDVAALDFRDVLDPQMDYTMRVKLHFEKKLSNGSWEALTDSTKQVDYETEESKFKTGDAPGYIPENNIAYTYPVNRQFNFYKDEYNKGYIRLIKGMPYLFAAKDSSGNSFNYVARYSVTGDNNGETALTYDAANTTVNFAISPSLQNDKVYNLQLMKVPAETGGAIDKNVNRGSTTVTDGDNQTTVANNKLDGSLQSEAETALYELAFRSSRYSTFAAKVQQFSNKENLYRPAADNLTFIALRQQTDELYDGFELDGDLATNRFCQLVQTEVMTDNDWYRKFVYPVIYEQYNSKDVAITWRDTALLGSVPLKAISTYNEWQNENFTLTGDEARAGTAVARPGKVVNSYLFSFYVAHDYQQLKNGVAAKYLDNGFDKMPEGSKRLFLNPGYEDIGSGNYNLKLNYRLPGTGKITTSLAQTIRFQ